MTQSFYFVFGGFPDLSWSELKSFQPQAQRLTSQLAFLSHLNSSPLENLQFRLGGTLKISQVIANFSHLSELQTLILKQINQASQKNIAISNYTSLNLPKNFVTELKAHVTRSRSTRFLSFKTSHHSLVALRKQHVLELALFPSPTGTTFNLTKTIWIQNSDQWVKKDRRKPYQDIKRGMLPPKIARILVNLATAKSQFGLLADPFCGTGTIAMEAGQLGFQIFASDLDPQAVAGTQDNLIWLQQIFQLNFSFRTQTLDATHLDQAISRLDFIVTEPYMGILLNDQLNLTPTQLANNLKGLDKLYKGALKNWYPLLSRKGRVVMIFPEFHLFNQVWRSSLIDTCENLGYNKLVELSYSQPRAKLVRKILVLNRLP